MKKIYSLVLAGFGLLTAAGYGQCGTPITSIPFNIARPGTYVLQGSLTLSSSSDAITVSSSFVTIDLGGFSIKSTAVPNSAAGISVVGFSDVTIQNGEINGGQPS
jgi:hypothetical protein